MAQEDIGVDVPWGISVSPDVSVNEEILAVASISKYKISFYNTECKLIKKITRSFNKLVRPGIFSSGNTRAVRTFGELHAPSLISSEYYITSATWPLNIDDPDEHVKPRQLDKVEEIKYKNMIDLFNKDGELLYSVYGDGFVSEIGRLAHVDKKGHIYTIVSDPFPQVRCYEVIINK